VRRPDVLSFMRLTSSRTTWISPKWAGAQMTGFDPGLTERWIFDVHPGPVVRKDEGRLVRVYKVLRGVRVRAKQGVELTVASRHRPWSPCLISGLLWRPL
jgi:hypothetical protein